MSETPISLEVGQYLVIWITGVIGTFIAEITQEDPLEMKVEETGPYARLKYGDFIIQNEDTRLLRKDDAENTCVFLEREQQAGREVISGLKSLGVTDGKLLCLLPAAAA